MQRQSAHLQTHFTVRKSHFSNVAKKLTSVSSNVLQQLANHLEHEKSYKKLNDEEKNALDLLKQVNTIASQIPGSQGSKIFTRNEIHSYHGYFGLPHIYFTFNPSAARSPIFQVMFADRSIDLSH